MKVLKFSEILSKALGIKIKKEEIKEELTEEEQLVLNTEANVQLEEELKEEDYDEMEA